uniref:Uncharacterized protein n=1 Tax=Oryza meridionalis TaxID=40149 RepID=A0A0E0EER4_9ORYZ
MNRYGLLGEGQNKLDYCLHSLLRTSSSACSRPLSSRMAWPSKFTMHVSLSGSITSGHIDFSLTSPLGGGPAGRVKRKNQKASGGGGDGEEEE